jgi:hypothetical protein
MKVCFLLLIIAIKSSFASEYNASVKYFNEQQADQEFHSVNGLLEYKTSILKTQFDLKLNTRADFTESERNYFDLQNAKLSKDINDFTLSFGQKIFDLKKLEGPDQIDVLNPVILDTGFINPVKKGVPFFELSYIGEKHEFIINYLPVFVKNNYPGESSQIILPNTFQEVIYTEDNQDHSSNIDQYVFQFNSGWDFLEGLETQFFLVRHVAPRFPFAALNSKYEIELRYLKTSMVALNATLPFSSWILKNQFIAKRFEHSFSEYDHNINVIGAEIPFYFIENQETTFFLEYTKVNASSDMHVEELNFMQNDLFLGVRQTFPSQYAPELKIGGILDLDYPGEHLLTAEYEQRLSDFTKLQVEIVVIDGNEKSMKNDLNLNSLNHLKNADYLKMGLQFFF